MSRIIVEKSRRVFASFESGEPTVAGGTSISVTADDNGKRALITDKLHNTILIDVPDLEDLRQAIYAVQVELAHWKQADG